MTQPYARFGYPMVCWRFIVGALLGVALPLTAGELYARYRPPADLQLYLGDSSPLTGVFRPDPIIGVDYGSFEAFRKLYAVRLSELGPLSSPQPTWAWFGNSFVQAPGMLGQIAQARFPHHRMFFLQRNESVPLRVAQIRQLLQHGLRPQRIFFVLLPLDIDSFGNKPIHTINVNRNGAITYRITKPPVPLDVLTQQSRLALLGWIRSGDRTAEPGYRNGMALKRMSSNIRADVTAISSVLGHLSKQYGVPITVVLIPNREQLFGTVSYHLQDEVAEIARNSGLDVFDARLAFESVANIRSVFLPDWHLNPSGNQLLLRALIGHLAKIGAPLPDGLAS
jgi:hypothetical protein